MRIPRPVRFGLAAASIAVLVAAGCGSDDKSSDSGATTTTAAAQTTTTAVNNAEVVRFDKTIQQELSEVGCYSGAIDGVFGPQTDAAVVAFQSASGLDVDGELGPETKAALAQAVSKKEKVCTSSASSTTTKAPATTTTAPSQAPCTATAIAKALPSGAEVANYACSEGYAGVSYTSGGTTTAAILQSESGAWKDLGNSMCGGASAGYPPAVLEIACPA